MNELIKKGISDMKTEVKEFFFQSKASSILPGAENYYCQKHEKHFTKTNMPNTESTSNYLNINDIFIEENQAFEYQIIKPVDAEQTDKVIFLFHGFNERTWDKYLTWANYLCESTGASVILFPIAFHMQRSPQLWSSKREMYKLSKDRKTDNPEIVASSLSNVAISIRVQTMPQRFIWSGLQTYYDIIQFIEECKMGQHEFISKDAHFDFFAYSIGGFLALTLKLANYQNYFSHSKVCLFCSGTSLNLMTPVSKFILDSLAHKAMYSYLVEQIDSKLENDSILNHYINEDHLEGRILYSLLDDKKAIDFREDLLKKHASMIYAIALKKDHVIPATAVDKLLSGAKHDIKIKVDIDDYEREYSHENPYPDNASQASLKNFKSTFKKFVKFFLS